MQRTLLRGTAVALLGLLAGLGAAWWLGGELMQPSRVCPPMPTDFPCEQVTIESGSGVRLAGWFRAAPQAKGSVLLLHSVRSNRGQMVPRARFLWRAGWSVLMVDMQAHGESAGSRITWGAMESRDAAAAARWLRARCPEGPVAVLGTSLGGAAALMAGDRAEADALVVEAVYADIRKAVRNRIHIRLGPFAAGLLEPLITWQLPLRAGIDPACLSPADAAKRVSCPVLVIHGAADRHALPAEGRLIYQNCPAPGKRWWEVPGAAHVDLHRAAGGEYEERVLGFLAALRWD